eukprot:938996-Heterocapsa_arctica.AAC.1
MRGVVVHRRDWGAGDPGDTASVGGHYIADTAPCLTEVLREGDAVVAQPSALREVRPMRSGLKSTQRLRYWRSARIAGHHCAW